MSNRIVAPPAEARCEDCGEMFQPDILKPGFEPDMPEPELPANVQLRLLEVTA